MDTLTAFGIAEAASERGAKRRVFDWEKAARILAERKPHTARAGLSSDMEYTAGTIWHDGAPDHDGYTYLSSNWAAPVLEIDGEEIDCWRYADETPDWGSDTKWPPEALAIVEAAKCAP